MEGIHSTADSLSRLSDNDNATRSLSLSHTHTHTHTHTHSFSLSPSLSLSLYVCLCVSVSLSLSHTHTHTLSLSLSLAEPTNLSVEAADTRSSPSFSYKTQKIETELCDLLPARNAHHTTTTLRADSHITKNCEGSDPSTSCGLDSPALWAKRTISRRLDKTRLSWLKSLSGLFL